MASSNRSKNHFRQPHLWLIAVLGVIVPRRLRADWRQEWQAELRHRESYWPSGTGSTGGTNLT